ncbi:hypothetical protein [uncultured Massilia sp.]|uniref:hypothetical protein n=1 Tax=uncultured Massilia sp. TaxID=169973 RepID=UPI0025CBDF33|nr:hypothetical protein [uncultured Massilia sp.]
MADQDRDPQDNAGDVPDSQVGSAAPAPADGLSAKGASRRRFAKTGAGAAGVLMTLHSTPGMATQFCGMAPSAAFSVINQKTMNGKVSYRGEAPVCSGQGPTWWSSRPWPSGCDSNDFKTFFSCSRNGAAYALFNARVLLSGANVIDWGNGNLGRYVMAAYLNAAAGYTSFLTTSMVQQIWNEWCLQGYYAPIAGKKWYANEIVTYLSGTMASA